MAGDGVENNRQVPGRASGVVLQRVLGRRLTGETKIPH